MSYWSQIYFRHILEFGIWQEIWERNKRKRSTINRKNKRKTEGSKGRVKSRGGRV